VLEAEAQVIAQRAAVSQALQRLAASKSQATESIKNGPQQVRA